MKALSKFCFLAFAMAMMISCAPTSKEKYMEKYVLFLDKVSQEYKDYTPKDWEAMDEKFDKFNGEWYHKYEQELSFKDELKLQGYKMKYAYYRALAEGRSAVDGFVESIDVDQMKKDVEDAAKDAKKAAEEFVNSIDMEQVQKDLEEVGEEIVKAAEEVGKTIDSLAGEWQN